jgi:methylated-DNA-protein-cysteine methyltransferase-like protein
MSPFKDRVIEIVSLVPPGKVVSYGQVALYIGAPRAARQVGWILRELGDNTKIPWWRVVNKNGKISISGNFQADKVLQRKLLQAEGVEVSDQFDLSIEKYRFAPDSKLLSKFQLSVNYLKDIRAKYGL